MESGTAMYSTSKLTPDSTWIGVLALICVAIILYGVFYSTNTATDPAYLVGFSLIPAIMLTALLRVACLRGRGVQPVLISFGAIFVSLMLCWHIAAHQQRVEALAALSSVQAEVARVVTAPPGERPAPTTQTAARGTFGELERFVVQFLQELSSLQDGYVSELTALGWEGVLDPARLRADVGLKRTQAMIKQAQQMVDRYEARHAQLIRDAGARVATLDAPADARRDIAAGFSHGVAVSKPMAEEQWLLERQIIAEIEALATLFRVPNTWEIAGDMVLFDRDEDVDEYNARMARLSALVERQERNAREGLAEFHRRMEGLKRLAHR